MEKKRRIAHIDINHCYAQIIEMLYPELKNVPMAVGGHEELRHGIILAKNLKAKEYNIKTAETLRDAKEKCPDLLIVPPKYDLFIYYTEKVKDIYREYTPNVESFGLDEAWVDLTNSSYLFGSAEEIARTIQKRVLEEVGLTVSIGLSYNKIFAKLGSDITKPSGFHMITEENFQDVVWKLPVEDLLYIGRKTQEKLNRRGIITIGDLANKSKKYLKDLMGKNGEMIWYFANGYDTSEVMNQEQSDPIKSVGNSITTPADISTFEDAKIVYQVLAESVASRLRDAGLQGNVISISIRDTGLSSFTRQKKIEQPSNISTEILDVVYSLLEKNYRFEKPLRSIGVSVSNLYVDNGVRQFNLFVDEKEREKQKSLEVCIDQIRNKYGYESINRLSVFINRLLTDFNPKNDHQIHPVSWF